MKPTDDRVKRRLARERRELLQRLEDWLEVPMLVLSFVWLALLLLELTRGESDVLMTVGAAIWVIFIIDFTVKLALAPEKLDYIKSNWLTAIALLVPALRVFRAARLLRVLRYARATRGVRLVRVLTSLNRGTKALASSFSRHGFGYVVTMTLVVMLAGAAGMYAFEKDVAGGLQDYGSAVWWTAMIMTTMGSEYWPKSPEGRLLCVVLSLYAFGVFGYVTATIASYLVGRDAAKLQPTAAAHSVDALRRELQALREEMARLAARRV